MIFFMYRSLGVTALGTSDNVHQCYVGTSHSFSRIRDPLIHMKFTHVNLFAIGLNSNKIIDIFKDILSWDNFH